jgi:hypothetical protein
MPQSQSAFKISLCVCLALLAVENTAFAGLSEWFTETAVSGDGKYILVTISNRPLDVELADDRLDEAEKERVEYVRSLYPKCGLYRNDGSNTPLWTYDGRWSVDPIVAPDGEHVVFPGGWTSNEYAFQAVEFTRRGKTIRSYDDSDIIPAWLLKFLASGKRGSRCDGYWFDPGAMTFTIRTNQSEEFTFDVRTGEIVATRSPFLLYFSLIGVFMVAMIATPIFLVRRIRHRKAKLTAHSGALGSCRR